MIVLNADPTGQTDSRAALQQAIDYGGAVMVPPGSYSLDGPVEITKPVRLIGEGGGCAGVPPYGITTIQARNLGADLFYVNAHGVCFEGLNLGRYGSSNTPSDGNAVIVGTVPAAPGQGWMNFRMVNCEVYGHCRAIWFQNAASWVVESSWTDTVYGLHIENRANFDAGDAVISNCTIRGRGDGMDGAAIIYTSGGGLKISNTKLLGGKHGVWMIFSENGSIGPQFSNVSIEGYHESALYVEGVGRCDGLTLSGCHFDGPCPVVVVDMLRQVAISGCVFGSNAAGEALLVVRDVDQFAIAGNVLTGNMWGSGAADIGIKIATPARHGRVGLNQISGVLQPYLNAGQDVIIS